MKKIILLVWTALLITIASILIFWKGFHKSGQEVVLTEVVQKVDSLTYSYNSGTSSECTLKALDSLFTVSNLVIITISSEDCHLCNTLQNDTCYQQLKEGKLYFNIKEYPNNNLLAQALHTEGFPTSYIINSNYNVVGVVEGIKDFSARMDSALNQKWDINGVSLRGVSKEALPAMLSYSLKSLVSYWKSDMQKTKEYAKLSLNKGSYFFNNYILYLVYKEDRRKDSTRYYRNRALEHSDHVNAYIYEDLITELKAK